MIINIINTNNKYKVILNNKLLTTKNTLHEACVELEKEVNLNESFSTTEEINSTV